MVQSENTQSVPLVQSAQIVQSVNHFQSENCVTHQPHVINTSIPTTPLLTSSTLISNLLIPNINNQNTLISNTNINNTKISHIPKYNTHLYDTLNSGFPISNAHNSCSLTSDTLKRHVSRVKPLKVKNHRRGKRNSCRLFTKQFKWLGNNIAGATSKWASVKQWVRVKQPVILSLQETKFQVGGKHKLEGYIVYEHLRKEKTAGGGLLLAVMQDLSPALVRDGGTEVEAITIDITVKHMQIVCSTAYGPQENDSKKK